MNRLLTTLIDADGVLVNFIDPFLSLGNMVAGTNVQREDITTWDILPHFPAVHHAEILAGMEAEGWCAGLPMLPGADAAVTRFRSQGLLYCVTSPWSSRTWCYERTSWLKHHLAFNPKDVLHVSAKQLVRGDILIDDKYETLVDWKAAFPEGTAILIEAPYNRSIPFNPNVWRARSWDEVFQLVDTVVHKNLE
jgi:5'(3')-deoxyribonucleotidase